jgi:hypothetical protein
MCGLIFTITWFLIDPVAISIPLPLTFIPPFHYTSLLHEIIHECQEHIRGQNDFSVYFFKNPDLWI